MRHIFFATVAAFALAAAASALDCGDERPTTFNQSLFLFRGQVTEIVGPVYSPYPIEDAWGLRITVDFAPHLPRPADEFVVVPVTVVADCSVETPTQDEISRSYPVGQKVLIVAQESESFPGSLEALTNRYQEVRSRPPVEVSGGAVPRYEPVQLAVEEVDSWFSFYLALKRMPEASTDEQRAAYARAMIPFISDSQWFEAIVRAHLIDPQIIDPLLQNHREQSGRIYSIQY